MEEEVLIINVRQNESVTLSLIEELESACYPVFKVLHVWIIWYFTAWNYLLILIISTTVKRSHIMCIRLSHDWVSSFSNWHWREVAWCWNSCCFIILFTLLFNWRWSFCWYKSCWGHIHRCCSSSLLWLVLAIFLVPVNVQIFSHHFNLYVIIFVV